MQADQPQRQKITSDGRRFSNMAGFYDEVERVVYLRFGLEDRSEPERFQRYSPGRFWAA